MANTYPAQFLNFDNNEVLQEGVISYTAGATTPANLNQVSPKGAVTSGALPTQQLVSTTGAAITVGSGATRDVETHTSVASTSAAGTVTVQLSPDNSTYSTLFIWTPATSLVTNDIAVRVPAGWFIKMTTSNATLGLTTVY